ncbi:ABC transporter ATP-binding protein [Nocardia sp. NPDC003963]
MSGRSAIAVRGLGARTNGAVILRDIGFDLAPGEILALFGPSGAGKTTIATAVAGAAEPGIELSGEIRYGPGVRVGYLPQHAASTLNPARRIGAALGELVALHHRRAGVGRLRPDERRARIAEALAAAAFELGDRELTGALRRYPFEFSGGERARLALAQVLAGRPDVLVVDEPTVGLDALARATLLEGLLGLRAAGTAVVLITHDSFAVERIADRILFVRGGQLVPAGSADTAAALPRLPAAPATEPALRIRELTVRHHGRPVLDRLDLELYPGEHLGLVGVSGAGKTTLARCIAGLTRPDAGEIVAWGERLPELRRRSRRRIADIQYVWQESAASFDSRRSVLAQVAATGTGLCGMTRGAARTAAADLLAGLGIDEHQATRPPAGLSGGQLQRAALARALLARPRVLLCDEVTTALDEPTARRILDRLDDYRERTGATLVSISHDLRGRLARCDRIAVLDRATIAETGAPVELIASPRTEILARLLHADGADTAEPFSQHQLERNR